MTFKLNLTGCLIGLLTITSCTDREKMDETTIANPQLLSALVEMGYEVEGSSLVINRKVHDTQTLDLSAKGLTSLEGIYVFDRLETLLADNNRLTKVDLSGLQHLKKLSLKGNKELKQLNGLDANQQPDLQDIQLPYSLRFACGELPAFCKAMSKQNKHFSARIEQGVTNSELTPYTYYHVFKNTVLANNFFRLLGEDNFMVIEVNGKSTEAFDMSNKLQTDTSKPVDLSIQTLYVSDYEDAQVFLNSALKYSGIKLRSLEISSATPKKINSFDELDLSGYTHLERVIIDNIPLEQIYFDGCTALQSVEIKQSTPSYAVAKPMKVSTLSFKDSPLLHRLVLGYMPLTQLELPVSFRPDTLSLESLQVQSLGKTDASKLKHLSVKSTPLTQLPILNQTLKYLWLSETSITSIDLSSCINLTERILLAQNEKLTAVTFPRGKDLTCEKIEVYKNHLQSIDLSAYKRIPYLATVTYQRFDPMVKGCEEYLTELKINPEVLVPPMTLAVDSEFLRTSSPIKTLYQKRGTEAFTFYRYGFYKYGPKYTYYENLGKAQGSDFESK